MADYYGILLSVSASGSRKQQKKEDGLNVIKEINEELEIPTSADELALYRKIRNSVVEQSLTNLTY